MKALLGHLQGEAGSNELIDNTRHTLGNVQTDLAFRHEIAGSIQREIYGNLCGVVLGNDFQGFDELLSFHNVVFNR